MDDTTPVVKRSYHKRSEKLITGAIPDSKAEFTRRRNAARKARKRVPRATVSLRVPINVFDALMDLAERHDVHLAKVMKRFIDDGLKTYGTNDDLKKAGLFNQKPNPFEEFAPDEWVPGIGETDSMEGYVDPVEEITQPRRIPGMTAGQPVAPGINDV